MVSNAGRMFADGKTIDQHHRSYLEQELLPMEEYYRIVNDWF
jgi:hypothetical protein